MKNFESFPERQQKTGTAKKISAPKIDMEGRAPTGRRGSQEAKKKAGEGTFRFTPREERFLKGRDNDVNTNSQGKGGGGQVRA